MQAAQLHRHIARQPYDHLIAACDKLQRTTLALAGNLTPLPATRDKKPWQFAQQTR